MPWLIRAATTLCTSSSSSQTGYKSISSCSMTSAPQPAFSRSFTLTRAKRLVLTIVATYLSSWMKELAKSLFQFVPNSRHHFRIKLTSTQPRQFQIAALLKKRASLSSLPIMNAWLSTLGQIHSPMWSCSTRMLRI